MDVQWVDCYVFYDKEVEELEFQFFEVFLEVCYSVYVQDIVCDFFIDCYYYDVAGFLFNEVVVVEVVVIEVGWECLVWKLIWYNLVYVMQMGLDVVVGNSLVVYLVFNVDISVVVKVKVVQLLVFVLEKELLDVEKFQVFCQIVGFNLNYVGQVLGRSWLVLLLYMVFIGGIGVWWLWKG